VQAHRLRKLLEAYYAAEGQADPFHILIPQGSHIPQVRRQGEMETAESAGSPPPPNPPLVVTQFSVETAVASNRRPVRRSAFAMGGSFAAGV
jgi:hypothetical protein